MKIKTMLIDLYAKCLRCPTLARNMAKIYSLKLALGVSLVQNPLLMYVLADLYI